MKRNDFFFFVTPSVFMMIMLMVVPFITAVWLSFNLITFQSIDDPTWVGLDNFQSILEDDAFWEAFIFTSGYIVFTVPIQIVMGLAIAMLLDQIRFMRGAYIAGSLLPFIVTPVVGTLIFRQIFDRYGIYPEILNGLLVRLGMEEVNFFSPEELFVVGGYRITLMHFLLVMQGVWYVTPFAMIVLFAGLQTLPQDPLEASMIDGANWWQRMRYVVLPHLRSLFVFIALINIMDAYRIFDNIFVLTKQNPIYGAESLMMYNYRVAITFGRLGRASAMSLITILGIFVVLIPFLYLTYKQQTEES